VHSIIAINIVKERVISILRRFPPPLRARISYFYPGVLLSEMLLLNFDKDTRTILDIGVGHGSPVIGVKENSQYFIVGIDAFLPYLKHCKARKIHNEYILCDARHLPFKTKTFDTVLFLDVLEHLSKRHGKAQIKKLEEIARKQVIIMAPVGFWQQGAYDNNIWQVHKSEWTPSELMKAGYIVRGLSGARFLWRYHLALSLLTEPLTYFRPELAFEMLCIKNLTQ